jgi:anti-sigma regulatory factor (Ser/Thr protein kinase)
VTADTATRTFGVSPADVAAIDDWLEQVGLQWGTSPRAVFAARLCVAELAGNVVEHAVAGGGDDHLVITVRRSGKGMAIEFLDSRAPFDPTRGAAAPTPELIEAAAVGGRGLMLLRAYARDLTYSHDGKYNRISLTTDSA